MDKQCELRTQLVDGLWADLRETRFCVFKENLPLTQ